MIKVSNSELEVMKIIWRKGMATSSDVIKELNEKKWGDNTIRTFLTRLVIKKAIGISKKEGKIYTYVALINKQVYQKKMTEKFIDLLYDGSNSEFMKFFNENFRIDIE